MISRRSVGCTRYVSSVKTREFFSPVRCQGFGAAVFEAEALCR